MTAAKRPNESNVPEKRVVASWDNPDDPDDVRCLLCDLTLREHKLHRGRDCERYR